MLQQVQPTPTPKGTTMNRTPNHTLITTDELRAACPTPKGWTKIAAAVDLPCSVNGCTYPAEHAAHGDTAVVKGAPTSFGSTLWFLCEMHNGEDNSAARVADREGMAARRDRATLAPWADDVATTLRALVTAEGCERAGVRRESHGGFTLAAKVEHLRKVLEAGA